MEEGDFGNTHFKNSKRQAPNFSIDGEKTEEHEIVLELKTIADVACVWIYAEWGREWSKEWDKLL